MKLIKQSFEFINQTDFSLVGIKKHIERCARVSYKSEDYCKPFEGNVFLNLKCVGKSGGFNKEGIKWFNGKYNTVKKLIDALQAKNFNTFYFITDLEANPNKKKES